MKRLWIGAVALLVVGLVWAQGSGVVTVQVLSAKLQATPSFLAPTTAKLVRGEQLTALETQKDWLRVTTKGGQSGWINRASVVEKAVALSTKPGGSQGGVSNDEV